MKYTRVVIIAMLTFTIHELKHIKFAVCEIYKMKNNKYHTVGANPK